MSAQIPRRLAQALIQSNARAFFMSYVMLQGETYLALLALQLTNRLLILATGIGLIPFQLLNFGTVFIIGLYSLWAKTPRGRLPVMATHRRHR